jgi:hypothetical protein
MIGQMAQVISYFPSPLLLFDRLLFPGAGNCRPIFIWKGQGRDSIDNQVLQFFPRDVSDCGLTFGL